MHLVAAFRIEPMSRGFLALLQSRMVWTRLNPFAADFAVRGSDRLNIIDGARASREKEDGMTLVVDSGNALTSREQQTLYLVACGLSNKEIAVKFGLSDQTVKTHLANMMAKLRKANRAALVTYGFEAGILRAE